MASKRKDQPVKHCQISTWLEAQDPELFEVFRRLCLLGTLRPRGHAPGVTFLCPEGKYRDEIVKVSLGENAEEAVALIEALILPDLFASGADFTQKPVGSLKRVKLSVESAEPKTVHLAGGIQLERADDFRLLNTRQQNQAVWRVTKGRLPATGEAFEPAAPKRRVRGGGPRELGPTGGRALLASKTECEFDRCMRLNRCRDYNPYLARSVSLLRFLQLRHPAELTKVLPLIDYNPILTFYILLQPYRTGPALLADEILFGDEGWNGAHLYENALADYLRFFQELASQKEPSAAGQSGRAEVPRVFSERARLTGQVDRVRQEVSRESNPWRIVDGIVRAYEVLASKNEIQGFGPVLPASTLDALGAQGLLWQAEMRFTIRMALAEMARGPYDPYTFKRIAGGLRTTWAGNDFEKDRLLLNPAELKRNVSPRVELCLAMKLLGSTDFLYLPAPPSAVGPPSGDPSDPTKWRPYFNASAFALQELQASGAAMVRPAGIGPKALLEVQAYVARHGALPGPVQALVAKP